MQVGNWNDFSTTCFAMHFYTPNKNSTPFNYTVCYWGPEKSYHPFSLPEFVFEIKYFAVFLNYLSLSKKSGVKYPVCRLLHKGSQVNEGS